MVKINIDNIKKEINETKTNIKMSWQFIKKSKKSLIVIIFLSLLLSTISVIVPILSAQLLLKLSNNLLMELLKVAIYIFFVEITRNVIRVNLQKIIESYMIKTIIDVQMKMFEETIKIEISEIDKNTSGAFIDRINNDTNDIVNVF